MFHQPSPTVAGPWGAGLEDFEEAPVRWAPGGMGQDEEVSILVS